MQQTVKEFGKRLYQLRNRHNITAVELARSCMCSVSSVFDWEAGAAMPDPKQLVALARIFRLPVEELLGGE